MEGGQDLENEDERLVQVPGKVAWNLKAQILYPIHKMFGFGFVHRLDFRVIIMFGYDIKTLELWTHVMQVQ